MTPEERWRLRFREVSSYIPQQWIVECHGLRMLNPDFRHERLYQTHQALAMIGTVMGWELKEASGV